MRIRTATANWTRRRCAEQRNITLSRVAAYFPHLHTVLQVRAALKDLGFDFLNEKQVDTIINKADADKNEVIDFEEFVKETPKVLRVNLVKLAKANGHDLGFLV